VLITCLMGTKNRRHMAPLALRCLAGQVLSPGVETRLVAIEDGEDDISDLIEEHLGGAGERTYCEGSLAAKINHAMARYDSDIYTLWDDDDWSHPLRLQRSLQAIEAGALATQYRFCPFFVPATGQWFMHVHDWGIDATLLFRRRYWDTGPPAADDGLSWVSPFIVNRLHWGRPTILPDQDKYIVIRHHENTSFLDWRTPHWAPMVAHSAPAEVLALAKDPAWLPR